MLISNHLYFPLSGDVYNVVIQTSEYSSFFVIQWRTEAMLWIWRRWMLCRFHISLSKIYHYFFLWFLKFCRTWTSCHAVSSFTHSCVFYSNSPSTVDLLIFFILLTIKSTCSCYHTSFYIFFWDDWGFIRGVIIFSKLSSSFLLSPQHDFLISYLPVFPKRVHWSCTLFLLSTSTFQNTFHITLSRTRGKTSIVFFLACALAGSFFGVFFWLDMHILRQNSL